MRIPPVSLNTPIVSITSLDGPDKSASTGDVASSFQGAMKKAVGGVNELQNNADQMAVKMATGDIEDVHQAMIAMQKAKLALDLTIQVRNKVVEAYQEIMRMQV